VSNEAVAESLSLAADRAMTADRRERKYLLPRSAYQNFYRALEAHLTAHRYAGEGANRLPGPQHFVTTIYFDTPSRVQYRNALHDVLNNIKIRAKEYYDEHPSLAEVASSADEMVSYRPWLWFELKRRAGQRTEKHRFRVSKAEAASFFDGAVSAALATAAHGREAEELGRIAEHCRALAEPLSASCLVNYRRLAWQNESSTLRVTMDLGVAYYAPPSDLWTRARALTRASLGAAYGGEPALVIEVKLRDSFPTWLAQTLHAAGAVETPFSKFISATRAVYGDG
jgi:hypothetical protein